MKPGDQFVMLSDMLEANGRTVRENNMEIHHKIPIGTLVEVEREPDFESEYDGIRLYVIGHHRDCDGTPLYSLGPKGHSPFSFWMPTLFAEGIAHGLAERSLRVVA